MIPGILRLLSDPWSGRNRTLSPIFKGSQFPSWCVGGGRDSSINSRFHHALLYDRCVIPLRISTMQLELLVKHPIIPCSSIRWLVILTSCPSRMLFMIRFPSESTTSCTELGCDPSVRIVWSFLTMAASCLSVSLITLTAAALSRRYGYVTVTR